MRAARVRAWWAGLAPADRTTVRRWGTVMAIWAGLAGALAAQGGPWGAALVGAATCGLVAAIELQARAEGRRDCGCRASVWVGAEHDWLGPGEGVVYGPRGPDGRVQAVWLRVELRRASGRTAAVERDVHALLEETLR